MMSSLDRSRQGPIAAPRPEMSLPPSYMGLSLVSVAFCFPLGIAAVMESRKVHVAGRADNIPGARHSSANAARLALLGVFLGGNLAVVATTVALCLHFQAGL